MSEVKSVSILNSQILTIASVTASTHAQPFGIAKCQCHLRMSWVTLKATRGHMQLTDCSLHMAATRGVPSRVRGTGGSRIGQ